MFCVVCPDQVKLARNGGYKRYIAWGTTVEIGWIYRKRCSRCKTNFSLLPSFLIPRMHYSRALVVWWLWACLWGVSSRNRVFLKKRAVECPTPLPDTSWSDQLEEAPSRPSHALLCHWTRRFSAMAAAALPALLQGFVFTRCSLRLDLAAWIGRLERVPMRAAGLALSLGLWRALIDSSSTDAAIVNLKESLPSLLDFLLVPRSQSFAQVRVPMADYDDNGVAGRSPP